MSLGLITERETMAAWRRHVYHPGKKKCYYVVIILAFRLKGKALWKGSLHNPRTINIYIKFEFVYPKSWPKDLLQRLPAGSGPHGVLLDAQ